MLTIGNGIISINKGEWRRERESNSQQEGLAPETVYKTAVLANAHISPPLTLE